MEDVSTLSERVRALGLPAPCPGALRCVLRSMGCPGSGLVRLCRLFAGVRDGGDSAIGNSREERAALLYKELQDWRAEIRANIEDAATQADIAKMRATKHVYWHGRNRQGFPICWLRPRLHGTDCSLESMALYYNEVWEEGCRLADEASSSSGGGGPLCVVYDRAGLGFGQSRRNASQCHALMAQHCRLAEAMVETNYHRLGTVYVINSGILFWTCYNFAKQFLTEETRSRCVVLRSGAHLERYVEPAQMPEEWRSQIDAGKNNLMNLC